MPVKKYIIIFFWFCLLPRNPGIPHSAITSRKADLIARRGQGDTPLGVPPPLGERGGHLRIFFMSSKR